MATPLLDMNDYLQPPSSAPASASAPAASGTGAAFKVGKGLAKAAKLGARFGGPLAAGATLAEGVLGEPTIPNAIRTGVGVGAIVNPAVGIPLATGMQVGGALTEFAGNKLIDAQLAKNDIRGPATLAYQARGGVNQPTATNTPADIADAEQGAVLSGSIPAAPAPAPAAVAQPATVQPAPGWQPAALPGTNTYRERTGVSGIGGIGGVGNTEVVGRAATSTNVGNIAGNFAGAILGLKQISGDNAQRLATQKAQAAGLAAQGTYARGAAAMGESVTAQTLAAEYLKKNPGDFAGAGAVLRGRVAGGTKSIPMGGVGLNPAKDPSLVFDKNSGSTSLVYPTQNITLAQAIASAKKNGTYKTDAQVRADLQKMPNYKLVD